MKKGYLFSLLVATLMAFLIITINYYSNYRPQPDVYLEMEMGRQLAASHLAKEVAGDFPAASVKSARITVIETRDAITLGSLDTTLARWSSFLSVYSANVSHNVSIDTEGSANLSNGRMELVARDVNYRWDGKLFWLNHTGSYVLVNDTIASVANTNCALLSLGQVAVRVVVNSFDSGQRYVNRSASYSCFINFSATQNMTITFDNSSNMVVDYTNAPTTLTQRVTFDSNASSLQAVFSRENVTTTAVDPGWNFTLNGTKRYGAGAGGNFILLDEGADGVYDYLFIDPAMDGFGNGDDAWYVQEGVVALNGKAFYTWFDLGGNWIMLHKALAVRSGGSWRGVAV